MNERTASGMAPGTWARGNPVDGVLPWCSLMIDHSEAEAGDVDLEAEGFAQMFAGPGAAAPTAELIAAIATPYDVELVRHREFNPQLDTQPAFMGGSFPDKHSPEWLDQAHKGLLVIVVPDLAAIGHTLPVEVLAESWCAFARVTRAR